MTETAKSKIKNFKNQITEKFNVGEANGFRTYIGKLSPINVLDMLDDIERSVSTDKLSVEKLQEIRLTELKDFNSKILQVELKNQKLKLDNKKMKNALTEIIELSDPLNNDTLMSVVSNIAGGALAAIGGENEN